MANNAIKWETTFTSRSTVLTTELNALGIDALTAVGTEIANQTNLDIYGLFELAVTFGSSPSAGGYVNIWANIAPDGTNYGSVAATNQLRFVCSIAVNASTAAQRLHSAMVILLPAKTKFLLENKAGVAFPASGSTVTLFTENEEIQ